MRIYIQQKDDGANKYFFNVPISTENKENKNFKRMYVNFYGCEPTTGNITPTDFYISGYKNYREVEGQHKLTGEKSIMDVKFVSFAMNIKAYEKTQRDVESDEKDKERGVNYIRPPYNAETIAKNKLNAYKRKTQGDEESNDMQQDFIDVPITDELLPF